MRRLQDIEPRLFFILVAFAFTVTLLGAYLYLFKREVLEISRLRAEKHEILDEFELQKAQLADTRIRALQAEVAELGTALYGQGGQMTPSQLISYVIAKLDGLSSRRGVQLLSIRPEARSQIALFEETPFSIEVKGAYRELYAWLQDAERELHPMVVKQFQIAPAGRAGGSLAMTVRVVSYRALEDGV